MKKHCFFLHAAVHKAKPYPSEGIDEHREGPLTLKPIFLIKKNHSNVNSVDLFLNKGNS